ncbi:MAG: alpha/beta hydrolase fold domain-containing protein [Polyangiaceae bacterium]
MHVTPRVSRVLRRAFDRSVHAAAEVLYLLPPTRPARHAARVLRDVPYRPTGLSAHLLDIYLPDSPPPHPPAAGHAPTLRPAVVYIHGGAFCMLSKDTHRVMALPFVRRGYVVFNINYRLGPTHRYPAPLEDAAAALTWVVDNAERYGADPRRLILAGESAGGNLVTALTYIASHPTEEPFAKALFDRAPTLAATVPIYGFLDLHDLHRYTDRPRVPEWAKREITAAASAYIGRPIPEAARRHPLASPLRLLEEPAAPGARPLPFFIACGTADMLLDDSRRLKSALDRRDTPQHSMYSKARSTASTPWSGALPPRPSGAPSSTSSPKPASENPPPCAGGYTW